jgi:ATPase family AAA domain-containing protein 3A/B
MAVAFSISTLVFSQSLFCMEQNPAFVMWAAEKIVDGTNEMARDFSQENALKQRKLDNLYSELDNAGKNGLTNNDPGVQRIQQQIEDLRRDKERVSQWADVGMSFTKGIGEFVIGGLKHEMDKKKMAAQIKAQGVENRKAFKEKFELFVGQLKDPKILVKLCLLAAGVTMGVVGVYFVLKICYQYIQMSMGKPDLVRESSRHGLKQSLKRFLSSVLFGDEEPEAVLKDIILSPEVEAGVNLLAEDTKQTNEYGLPYQNTLFYGPPGTGKTEFARILAKYSGMDYAILSGGDFSQFQNGEAVTELHKLFKWAEKSSNGLIIFIDEADAFLRDRSTLDKNGVNLVNAFLSQTGTNSDKFMIILATNYEDELDSAVRSRIHKKFAFLLPELEERFKILKQKLDKYVFEDSREYEKDGEVIEASLTMSKEINNDYLRSVADKINGFSGRDIDQAVAEMRLRAYRSGKNIVTKQIFDYVIDEKIKSIEKDMQTTEYQKQRFDSKRKKFGTKELQQASGLLTSSNNVSVAVAQ